MMKTYRLLLVGFIGLMSLKSLGQENFYAFYTKVVHTSTDYFGKYADLIVVIGDSQLEFARRTQYLPRWVTPNGSFMVDDFNPDRDDDFQFNYNYVRLIEHGPEKIVVHWRYFPEIDRIDGANADLNPTFIGGFTAAVHEFFTIYPSGKIERLVKDARGSRYENWINPNYADRQILQLTETGVEHGSVSWGDRSMELLPKVEKNPVINTKGLAQPVMAWTFNEGGGDYPKEMAEEIDEIMEEEPEELVGMTLESASMELNKIEGHMAVYKKGVSGTALGFDGYYTGISYEEEQVDFERNELSLEAWIALDVYPFNEAPIIHRSQKFGSNGFYLGIDPYGKLLLRVNGKTVKSSDTLPLYIWTHVAATIKNNAAVLYLNGKEVGDINFEGNINAEIPITIGINTERERCTDYVRDFDQNIPFLFGIRGMLDEVKVYDKALSARDIKEHYTAFLPTDRKSPLKKAILPGEVGISDKFGAYYKNLEFHELWDKMWRLAPNTNIVVKFDNSPASVVYWHGTNFAANWVTDNNRWMADQSSEIFTKHGCSEHMADKQTRHSYARIIENTNARVVVHWRYPCVDVGYVCTNKRNWSDEFHTIYPDGTAIRKVVYNNVDPPGFQDIQFFTNPGETALDVVDLNAMTVANTSGQVFELIWEKPNKNPDVELEDATIQLLNSKSIWKVFAVYPGPGLGTWGSFEQSKYTDDPFAGPWNHWPVSIVPSDGRFAVAHDRVTHFALGAADSAPEMGSMVMYGFTDQEIDKIVPLARYWQNPPKATDVKGVESIEFVREEKAYYLKKSQEEVSFSIQASEDSPVVNPVFILANRSVEKPTVKIENSTVSKNLRIGHTRNTEGKINTIIWLDYYSDKPFSVSIK